MLFELWNTWRDLGGVSRYLDTCGIGCIGSIEDIDFVGVIELCEELGGYRWWGVWMLG